MWARRTDNYHINPGVSNFIVTRDCRAVFSGSATQKQESEKERIFWYIDRGRENVINLPYLCANKGFHFFQTKSYAYRVIPLTAFTRSLTLSRALLPEIEFPLTRSFY